MFLIHFVGDIHQPLHLGRASDRGGNSITVTFNRKKTNLHSLWDSGLINYTKLDRGKYLKGLIGLARKMEPGSLDPVEWATGSLKLAYSNAYLIPKDGKLGDAYYGRNISVVNQQLAIAGVRLAAVLNDLFDQAEPAATQPE
jgi:nuclease S1